MIWSHKLTFVFIVTVFDFPVCVGKQKKTEYKKSSQTPTSENIPLGKMAAILEFFFKLFTCKLAIVALLKRKYSFEFWANAKMAAVLE